MMILIATNWIASAGKRDDDNNLAFIKPDQSQDSLSKTTNVVDTFNGDIQNWGAIQTNQEGHTPSATIDLTVNSQQTQSLLSNHSSSKKNK